MLTSNLLAQHLNFGTPQVQNFSPKDYKAGTQNWDLIFSEDGMLYAANNDGLLTFDGSFWSLLPLPNKTIARSLFRPKDGKIYIGGQDELGFFSANSYGHLNYTNLLDKIPPQIRNIEDIWQLEVVDTTLYFRNRRHVYKETTSASFEIINSANPTSFMKSLDGTLYYNSEGGNIYARYKDRASVMDSGYKLGDKNVIDLLKLDNGLLLFFTEREGIFSHDGGRFSPFQTNCHQFLEQNQITTAIKLNSGLLAIGTRLNGVLILDQSGRGIYHINKNSGLQNNSITSLVEDNWGNVWAASYYGIDRISFSSSLTTFSPDGDLQGAVYDIALWQNRWWFATSNGLYTIEYKEYYHPLETKKFSLVPKTKGQVWGLDTIQGSLFMGHNDGAFVVENEHRVKKIGNQLGAWKFVALSEGVVAVGMYEGIHILARQNGSWTHQKKLRDFDESSRILFTDTRANIWVSHPYRGVFRMEWKNDQSFGQFTQYTETNGLISNKDNYIFDVFGIPYVVNESGIFKYDYEQDLFKADSTMMRLLQTAGRVRRLFTKGKELWYIAEHETGRIQTKNSGLDVSYIKEGFPIPSAYYVAGFEQMHLIDTDQLLICGDRGILHFRNDQTVRQHPLKAFISRLQLTGSDSLLIGNHYTPDQPIRLNTHENDIRWSFRTNGKTSDDILGYSYKLAGYGDDWSEFNLNPSKEYTNLQPGEYTFLLRTIDKKNQISEVSSFPFIIKTPWHKSTIALYFYGLAVFLILVGMILIPRSKFKKIKENLISKQMATEQAIEEIKKEKLKSEIKFKNAELANSTLHLLQKNQTLSNIESAIERVRKATTDPIQKKELKNIVKLLKDDERIEDDWKNFSFHFDQVHHDFIQRLSAVYPNLTLNDHKLCAYLKMNLSTKEIAPLLNISIRGVEISRYRLRKKLNLDSSVHLNEFMAQF